VIFHPAAILRQSAQWLRHAPGLRRLDGVWLRLRAPYRRILTGLAGGGLPVVVGGQTMKLSPDVVNLNWETVEVEAYRVFAGAIKPGDIVCDIGAHFGTYCLIAVARGARVVAYEPCQLTRKYLSRHLEWNGAAEGTQVLVRPICCGNSVGTTKFFHRPDWPEGINGVLPQDGLVETTVPMTTIDREVEELRLTPSLIKIDVEGAELDVLMGASRVLAVGKPRLLVSLHPKRLAQIGLTCDDITSWLNQHGYASELISEDQEVHVFARPR
jgi:FkbM family methyltransferase